MALFRIHLVCGGPALLEIPIDSLQELGRSLSINRFLCGSLLEETGERLNEPVEVLIPSTRIHLVAQV